MRCKCCGKEITRNRYSGYCQACYRYFVIEGKRLYDTPEIGKVVYAENGDAICHICGKAFRKLGGHI